MYHFSRILKSTGLKNSRFYAWFKRTVHFSETNIDLMLAVIVGIGAGFCSVFFRWLLHEMHYLFFEILWPFLRDISPYLLPVIPMLGAIFLIPFERKTAGRISGYGMPNFLISVHLKGGLIRTKTIFVKIFTSALTISSGGSAGVEGPIAQVGGAVGSMTGRFFEMGSHRLKVLIACGAAAGIAAQFNAPLAGVLFAQEIIMIGQFQLQSFGVIVIASGLATAISRAYYSSAPHFGQINYTLHGYYEFGLYILLGLVIGVFAAFFIKAFFYICDRFKDLKIHHNLKPILGAFLVGTIGIFSFEIMGDGYETIKLALNWESLNGENSVPIYFFAGLIFLKILATSITLGSGNVGGLFAPSLYIGAVIGVCFGGIMDYFFPELNIQPGSYALVGMGAFLAASTHAPMTSIFLLFELTSNYEVIIPIMFASVIGVMVAKRLSEDNLDSMELSRQGIVLHMDKEDSLLSKVLVDQVMLKEFETIPANMSFANFMEIFPNSKAQYYPVMNNQNKMTGIVAFQDIREILMEEGLEHLVVMQELAKTDLITLFPHDTLAEGIKKFGLKDIEAIPVVDPEDHTHLLGILKRKDVLDTFNRATLMQAVKPKEEHEA